MRGSFLLISTCLMLTACSPNKAEPERPKNPSGISIEQQKRDAAASLELENTLLNEAKVELDATENVLIKRVELEKEQNQQMLIDAAKDNKTKTEQQLIERAKLKSDQEEALLNQAAQKREPPVT